MEATLQVSQLYKIQSWPLKNASYEHSLLSFSAAATQKYATWLEIEILPKGYTKLNCPSNGRFLAKIFGARKKNLTIFLKYFTTFRAKRENYQCFAYKMGKSQILNLMFPPGDGGDVRVKSKMARNFKNIFDIFFTFKKKSDE